MGQHEGGTLAGLKAHLGELIDPKIAEYGGRTVKSMGDGLLLEFPSVVDAVRCAVDVQRGMAERNATVPKEQRIEFRIGINVGDIIIDGADIFGDGVNVAARLQTLADPGGICVSRVVRDQVLDKLNFTFEDLGSKAVKNIARAVEVYRVLDAPAGAPAEQPSLAVVPTWSRPRLVLGKRWHWIASGVVMLGVLIFALVAFIASHPSTKESPAIAATKSLTETNATTAVAKPDENSVAVLPFTNLSDDKNNEYFSDGISEELLTVLQKIPGLHVAARLSAFSFKGKNATAPEIGEKLGVAHLVEGSVRKSGTTVRISARLSRAANGQQLWSDSYTRDLKDVFAVQSELAQTIVEQLRGQLGGKMNASAKAELQAQVQAAVKGGTKNAEAYQLYLQGIFFLNQFSPATAVKAATFLQRAVALDPAFALAWAALSQAGSVRGGYSTSKRDFDEGFALAQRAADRALALEPELSAAHLARMRVQMWYAFDWKGAAESLRRARKVAPTDADVIAAASGLAYAFGQREKAVEFAQQAVSRDPVNAEMRVSLGFSLESVGRYEEAETQFRRVIELSPSAPWGHAAVGLVFLSQERFDEAVREAEREADEWTRLTVQAQALWGLNKKRESDAALDRLIAAYADTAAFQIAQVYAYRRDGDRAFEWLERAYRQHDPGLAWSRSDTTLARLHDDPRWPAFLKRMGIADQQLK